MSGVLKPIVGIAFALFFASAVAEESIPKTDPVVSGEVAGYAVFANPGPLLDALDTQMKATFSADVYAPGSARLFAGRALMGDQAIFKNAGEKPFVALYFVPADKDTVVVFAELQKAFFVPFDDSKIETALREAGFRTEIVEGVLVAASTAETLAQGKTAVAQYKAVLQKAPKSGLRIAFNLAALYEGREPGNTARLEAVVKRKNPLMDQPAIQKSGLTATDFLMSTLLIHKLSDGFHSQCAVIQADFDLNGDALQVDVCFEAKKGTVLESFLVAPSTNRPAKLGPMGLMGVGAMHVFGNPLAQVAALGKLKAAITADERLTEFANSAFLNAWTDAAAAWGGETYISLGGKDFLPYSLSTVADVEKHRAASNNMLAPFKTGSMVTKLMSVFNFMLNATYSPEARKRGETPVGISSVELDTSKVNRAQFPKLASLPLVSKYGFETAIVKDVCVTSASPANQDKLIDRISSDGIKTGKPLQSEEVYGPLQTIYLDIDLPQLALAGIGSDAPAAAKIKIGSERWVAALGFENGRARLQSKVPFAPVEEYLRSIGPMIPDLLKTINRSRAQKP